MSEKSTTVGIIFAAGKGSRLAPLTDTLPKPLMPVGKTTLIKFNMAKIYPHVDSFVIVIGYLGDLIKAHIGNTFLGKEVVYAVQANPKGGTLDALRTGLYQSNIPEHANVIVSNSDDIHGQVIFDELFSHISLHPDVAAVTAHYLENKELTKNFGVFEIDEQAFLKKVWEKPQTYISSLINLGIYYFPAQVRNFVSRTPNTSTEKEEYITDDLFNPYLKNHPIKVVVSSDIWVPISNPTDLKNAQDTFPDLDIS